MPQGQANVVKTIEQAVLAKRLHLERQFLAIGFDDLLALQINRQAVTRKGRQFIKKCNTIGSRPFLKLLLKKMSA